MKNPILFTLILAGLFLTMISCAPVSTTTTGPAPTLANPAPLYPATVTPVPRTGAPPAVATMTLTSAAFKPGEAIPKKHAQKAVSVGALAYRCPGENVSPALAWGGAPAGAKSLLLVVEDREIGTSIPFLHWVVWNIPPTATGFAEGTTQIPDSARQGKNHFGLAGYGGPCSPVKHRYAFTILALDTMLDWKTDREFAARVEEMVKGFLVGKGELTGTYSP